MKNVFKIICRKCQGKCCNLNMMLIKKDYLKLKNRININKFRKYGKSIYVHWGRCPFLDEQEGCTLPERLKPFDCKSFPLTFMYEKNKIKIFLNKKCPYTKEISEKGINKIRKWLLKELKDWTEEEKKVYTDLIKKHSSSKLIPLN